MKINFTTLLWATLISLTSISQKYQYKTDLSAINKDKLIVELVCPQISSNSIIYYFPKTISGSYSELDYARYISEFSAYDSSGNELKIEKKI